MVNFPSLLRQCISEYCTWCLVNYAVFYSDGLETQTITGAVWVPRTIASNITNPAWYPKDTQHPKDLNSPQGYLHIKEFSSKIVNNTLFNQTSLFMLKYKYPKHGQVTLDKNWGKGLADIKI